MTKPHGWFEIPGVQTGERDLKERVTPLRPLLRFVKGASILDLGCAEGLISKWLVDEGRARIVHGLDKHPPYLETARAVMPRDRYKAKFDECDFDHFERDAAALGLLKGYDVVLMLNVAQKLKDPKKFLLAGAKLATNYFVFSGPAKVIDDIRSNNVRVKVEKELRAIGFALIHFDPGRRDAKRGHLGVRMIFQRVL